MDLESLIAALSRPDAYPNRGGEPVVVQTHISVVFLVGDRAYKIKKPVDLGFLDFTTLERRRHFCREEVRLNRRLAPDVYLGVAPIVGATRPTVSSELDPCDGSAGDALAGGAEAAGVLGSPESEGDAAIDYAVVMRRLPDEATFAARLASGTLGVEDVTLLARRLSAFHAAAASGAEVSRWGASEVVAGNVRENFTQVEPYVGETVSAGVFARLRERAEEDLSRLGALIDARAARGVTRDTHGDLQLKHVYAPVGAVRDEEIVVVDCIEFNERFRFADPVADIAFLDMDLRRAGRADLARAFTDAYLGAAVDAQVRRLLTFYTTYRAIVRAKVEGFASRGREVPAAERDRARERARACFLLALTVSSPPRERPALVLSIGLPGTGKSWLARHLAAEHGFAPVSTDRVRKSLAGIVPQQSAAAAVDRGIYAPEWGERTYAECLALAEGLLFEGRRVAIDGTFRQREWRAEMLALAERYGVPAMVLECTAPPDVVRDRLAHRRGDPSDADWAVHQALAARWEPHGDADAERVVHLDTARPDRQVHGDVRAALQARGLA